MNRTRAIPVFTLFGETSAFPDVLHCERFSDRAPDHGWRIGAHRHMHMAQLFCIESGTVEARVDGETFPIPPGTFLYVPPRLVHGFVFSPGTEGFVLSFPQPVLESIGPRTSDLSRVLSRCQRGPVAKPLAELVALLDGWFAGAGTHRAQRLVGAGHALLAAMGEACDDNGPDTPPRLDRLDALIADHLSDGWRPGEYASAMMITTGHLSRLCRDASGLSAQGYIDAAVMAEASRLLAFTQMSVSEIGYRTGFSDPSYFSRRFRAAQGESPSDYRARFAE